MLTGHPLGNTGEVAAVVGRLHSLRSLPVCSVHAKPDYDHSALAMQGLFKQWSCVCKIQAAIEFRPLNTFKRKSEGCMQNDAFEQVKHTSTPA